MMHPLYRGGPPCGFWWTGSRREFVAWWLAHQARKAAAALRRPR